MIPVQGSKFPPGWIVTPTGMVPRFLEFWDSVEALRAPEGTGRGRNSGPDCDSNRNRSIRTMLTQTTAAWALFLDDDQEFGPDTLMNMLEIMYNTQGIDVKVLTALYTRKTPPFQPVLFGDPYQTIETRMTTTELSALRKQGNLVKVGGCGAGCLLVKREVLESVYTENENGTKYWFSPGPNRMFGGDIGFCRLLKDSNVDVYAWLEPVGHIMPSVIRLVWSDELQTWQLEFTFGGAGFRVNFVETLRDNT